MKSLLRRLTILLLLLGGASGARADIALLLHGYMSDAGSWERSGITATLHQQGWGRGGIFLYSPTGLTLSPGQSASAKTFYTMQIPFNAPAMFQADWLQTALRQLSQRHPGEKITLVAHSAGGVVARLALVRYGAGQINRLITIAAPHLGTDRAIQALNATDNSGMFGFIKEWFVRDSVGSPVYNTLESSRGILLDLVPPAPGTLLYWLNGQKHPAIEYVSIVRSGGHGFAGDMIVPAISQDMNRIPALQGKSRIVVHTHGHELSPADGQLLIKLL